MQMCVTSKLAHLKEPTMALLQYTGLNNVLAKFYENMERWLCMVSQNTRRNSACNTVFYDSGPQDIIW